MSEPAGINTLSKHSRVLKRVKSLLDVSRPEDIETLAQRASKTTLRYFGRTVSLYAPLYLSNFCENECLYCGFNSKVNINRKQLSVDEINKECRSLTDTGIQDILLLTGESRSKTPVSYIIEAINTAKDFFSQYRTRNISAQNRRIQIVFQGRRRQCYHLSGNI